MHATQATPFSPAMRSLPQQIADFRQLFSRLEVELRGARREISQLQQELETERLRAAPLRAIDLPSLRRYVVFRCHPDRGGNTAAMQVLNQLFDALDEGRLAKSEPTAKGHV